MSEIERVLGRIEEYGAYAVELQRGLTAIPALAPSSGGEGEWDKAEWLESQLRKLPFDSIERFDCPQEEAKNGLRPNIVCRYRGRDSSRTLWIMTHMDVVPPGELKHWKTDPFQLHVEGSRLYGRGVEDNQQGLVASILCAKAMMERGVRPPVDLGLLFNADEETGSKYGAGYLAEKHRELFGEHDMFIVPDGGNSDGSMIEIAEKSCLWIKLTTLGKQCHASTPAEGRNAFKAASHLVVALGALYDSFDREDPLYDPPGSTFEPTKKEPNVPNVNTIPGEDVFYVDARILPEYPLADVLAEVRRLADQVARQHGVTVEIELEEESEAAPPTPADSPIVDLVARAAKAVHGVDATPQGIGGGTVAAVFRELGLPAVVYCKIDELAHEYNEYCKLDNLIADAKVFAHVALSTTPAGE